MQNFKLIENKDSFQRPTGTYSFAVVTENEKSNAELIYRCCDHEHLSMDEAKGCPEAIKCLEDGGFDPTGRIFIEKEQILLKDLINKYPAGVLTKFDYENKATWPDNAQGVLMFAPGTGFYIGYFQLDDLMGPIFSNWKNRLDDEKNAFYNEVPNVTHYLILEAPK